MKISSFGSAVDAILAARDYKKLRPERDYEIMREWLTYWPAHYFQVVDVEDETTNTWEPVVNFFDEIQVQE
jgi:hypothetical protein